VALGDHSLEHFDCPCITGLKTELMDRHAAHSWARIVERSVDQGRHDIDGERLHFAALASDRMNSMPAYQRRSVVKSVLE
jgi:hypothetical protein